MKLEALVKGWKVKGSIPQNLEVFSVDERASSLEQNSLFVAVSGTRNHGLDFVEEALKRGAAAILSDRVPSKPLPVPVLHYSNPRSLILPMELRLRNHPEQFMKFVGITGTNGKTTTASLVSHVLGPEAAYIGTTHVQVGRKTRPAPYTTPPSNEIAAILSEAKAAPCSTVVMEVSSHALQQDRVRGLLFDVGVFLNLQRDHLDYHRTMARYFAAKKRLFRQIAPSGRAVVNVSDPYGCRLAASIQHGPITFGWNQGSDIYPLDVRSRKKGTDVTLQVPNMILNIASPLHGDYNVENLMAAVGILYTLGRDLKADSRTISTFPGARGRLQRVPNELDLDIFVDYAHTPEGITKALTAVKKSLGKRIISVLGAGGDRDPGKRVLMGAAAGEMSDIVIITTDNPRSESPRDIAMELVRGVKRSGQVKVLTILNRSEAIRTAIRMANPGFVVMLLGK